VPGRRGWLQWQKPGEVLGGRRWKYEKRMYRLEFRRGGLGPKQGRGGRTGGPWKRRIGTGGSAAWPVRIRKGSRLLPVHQGRIKRLAWGGYGQRLNKRESKTSQRERRNTKKSWPFEIEQRKTKANQSKNFKGQGGDSQLLRGKPDEDKNEVRRSAGQGKLTSTS